MHKYINQYKYIYENYCLFLYYINIFVIMYLKLFLTYIFNEYKRERESKSIRWIDRETDR